MGWDSGTQAHRVSLSPCLPDPGASLSLCLLSLGSLSFSESVSLLPLFLTFSGLTEVGKCGQRCQPPLPPKNPLPHSFLCALEWCGRGQEMACAICLAQVWPLVVGSTLPQVPTPSSSGFSLDTFLVLRVLSLGREVEGRPRGIPARKEARPGKGVR